MRAAHPVVIVGLGPVGATLALLLARAGVQTLVVEREGEVHALSRAVALNDVALRVLQSAGLAAETGPSLHVAPVLRFASARGQPLLELPVTRSTHGHPAVAFFHQPELERRLRAALAREPTVHVLPEHELRDFEQHGDRVVATVVDRRARGALHVNASFVVGCDGARSVVRRLAGIRMRGYTSRRRWLVADVISPSPLGDNAFEFTCDPRRPTVSAPLPGGRHRFEFMLLPGETAEEMARPEAVRALIARRTSPAQADGLRVLRADAYAFHVRVADCWRRQRVFIAGDAAHLSPPFAGLGLSSGLRDADNLAWKLAAAVGGSASEELLSSYERERRSDAVRLIARAVALGTVVQTTRPPLAAIRDAGMRAVGGVPATRGWAARGGWKPPTAYRQGFIEPGRTPRRSRGVQIPQPTVRVAGTSERRLDDVLGHGFALVALGIDPRAHLDTASRHILNALPARIVCVGASRLGGAAPPDVITVEDATGMLREWLRRAEATLALVRPDRYAFAFFAPEETTEVLRGIAARIGIPVRSLPDGL